MKVFQKLVRYTLNVFATLLGVLLLAIILLRIPAVQTHITSRVAKYVQKKIGTPISISAVNINFLDNATINGLYVEDQEQDTLLYVNSLSVDVGFFKSLNGTIDIENIELGGVVSNLKQNSDSVFNFQYIVDSFASEEKSVEQIPTDTPSAPLNIEVHRVVLTHIRNTSNLLSGTFTTSLSKLELEIDKLDLENQIFNLDEFVIDGLHTDLLLPRTETQEDTSAVTYPLSGLPFGLVANTLEITNTQINFHIDGSTKSENFNAENLQATIIELVVSDIALDSVNASLTIENATLSLDNSINVKELSVELDLSPTAVAWSELSFRTDKTKLTSEAILNYSDFINLVNLDKNLALDISELQLNLAIEEVLYLAPQLKDIDALSGHLTDQFTLDAALKGNINQLTIEKLNAALGTNKIVSKGIVRNVTDPDYISFSQMSVDGYSSVSELRKFIDLSSLNAGIGRFGNIYISSLFSGDLRRLNLHKLVLKTDGNLMTRLSGSAQNLGNTSKLAYQMSIDTIVTSAADMHAAVDSLPSLVDSLGAITYSGKLKGNMTEYILNGALHSNQGTIYTDFDIDFNDSFSNAQYLGSLQFAAFDLGSLLANDSLGILNATINLEGKGIAITDLNTALKVDVASVTFNSYTYENALLVGQLKNQEFTGRFDIKDKNITLDFDGLVNLDDSIPQFDFDAKIEKLNLYALNLTNKPLEVKLAINVDFKGKNIDEIVGRTVIHGIEMYNGSDYYRPDSFILNAGTQNGNRKITLESPIAEMSLEGNFELGEIDKIILAFADSYYPFSKSIESSKPGDFTQKVAPHIRGEKLDFNLRLIEPTNLTDFLDIPLEKLDYASFNFTLSAPEDLLEFTFFVPQIIYNSTLVDSIYITADNKLGQLNFNGSIDSIGLSPTAYIPQTNLSFAFKEDKGLASVYLKNDSNMNALGLEVELTKEYNVNKAKIVEPFYLNAKKWQVQNSTPLLLSDSLVQYPSIKLSNGKELLELTAQKTTLGILLDQFKLSNLANIIQLDSITVAGLINGNLELNLDNAGVEGNITIANTTVNSSNVGTLAVELLKKGEQIDAEIELSGNKNQMILAIDYGMNTEKINGNLDIEALYLKPFEPFFSDILSNTSGNLKGNLDVSGSLSRPVVNGIIKMQDVAAKIEYLGGQFKFENSNLSLSENSISTNVELIDINKQRAMLTGKVDHTYYEDFQFDLKFNAKNFKFLNTQQTAGALYYGVLYADVEAKITGDIDLPVVKADVRTAPKTDIAIQLLSEQAVLSQENYIIFIDGAEKYSYRELDSIANARYKIESFIDLTLNLETHEEAQFSVIIDPITQDRLKVRGDAKLRIKMPPSGDLTINGTYVVSDGSYRFSYQDLLKRKFEIVPGGKITFSGSPYSALLDIQAKYQTKASVLPLLTKDINSLSEEDRNQYKKTAEIDVVLSVKGSLATPALTFDIQVPEYSGGATQSGIASSLQRIKQNESDLNKQVFSLMLFNSFTGDQSKGNVTGAGTSTAIRSVGNLINNQLNSLIGKSNGFEVNFEADNYNTGLASGNQNTVTELDLGVSQSLMNDRITLSVGGNVDLESDKLSNQSLSNISGDFVVAYRLTEDGKYQAKVFQRTDYDALNESNFWKTGIGFTYRNVFGKKSKK